MGVKASAARRHLDLHKKWQKKFSSVLKASRQDADLTQHALGAELGWSRAKVAKFEASGRIQAADFIVWCHVLKLDPTRVFERIVNW